MPGLQMADVRRLPIVIPEPEEQAVISGEVEELFVLQDRIRQLKNELVNQQGRIWPEGKAMEVASAKSSAANSKAKQPLQKSAS